MTGLIFSGTSGFYYKVNYTAALHLVCVDFMYIFKNIK